MKTGLEINERPLKILVVDGVDHTRDNLAAFLQLQGFLKVVGTTAVAAQAIHLVQNLRPDVVIMEINLPDLDGFAATKQLLQSDPQPAVILLTTHRRLQDIQQAQEAGAIACIEKSAGVDAILEALRALSKTH